MAAIHASTLKQPVLLEDKRICISQIKLKEKKLLIAHMDNFPSILQSRAYFTHPVQRITVLVFDGSYLQLVSARSRNHDWDTQSMCCTKKPVACIETADKGQTIVKRRSEWKS